MQYLPEPLDAGLASRLRGIFESAGYAEDELARLYGVSRLCQLDHNVARRGARPTPASACELLATLFLDAVWVERGVAEAILPAPDWAVIREAGLIQEEDGRLCARFHIYPSGGLLIASDRWSNPDGTPIQMNGEIVYPSINPNTQRFIDLLPGSPCDSFLDIGAGTGVGALLAARSGAREVVASDVLPSCTSYVRFNAALNGLENITAVTSDVYAALSGRTFDRIVCHPPYVPSILPRWVFYNGGEDGESITGRVVEGLPAHLRPGGLCLLQMMGSDRAGQGFESRVREWLGEAEAEFDVAFLIQTSVNVESFAARVSGNEVRSQQEFTALMELFRRLKVDGLNRGLLLLQRHKEKSRPFTVRRECPAGFGVGSWEWLLRWEAAAISRESQRILLDTPLHQGRTEAFDVRYRLEDSEWIPSEYALFAREPFVVECRAHPWMANLIALCDGRGTGREHMETLKQAGVVAAETSAAEFAEAMAGLVSGGFVEVEGFRPPRAAG